MFRRLPDEQAQTYIEDSLKNHEQDDKQIEY